MSTMQRLRGTDVSPRTALFSIVLLLLASTGAIVGVKKYLSPGGQTTQSVERRKPVDDGRAVKPAETDTAEDAGAASPASIEERNLFAPLLTEKPSPEIVSLPPPPPPPPPKKEDPPLPPPRRIETKHLAVTGIVTLPTGVYALLEETAAQKAEYVPVGGSAFGFRVTSIEGKIVTVEQDGLTATLQLGENKIATSIGKPAEKSPAATKPEDAAKNGGASTAPPGVTPGTIRPGGRMGRWGDRRPSTAPTDAATPDSAVKK